MARNFGKWFEGPLFVAAESEVPVTQLLKYTLWVMLAAGILVPLVVYWGGAQNADGVIAAERTLWIGGGVILASLGLLVLLRVGRVRLVAALLCLALGAIVSFTLFSMGTLMDVIIVGYFLPLILAGLILGIGGLGICLGLTMLSILFLYMAQVRGLMVPLVLIPSEGDVLLLFFIFGMGVLSLRFAINELVRRTLEARTTARELEAIRRDLEQRIQLELEQRAQLHQLMVREQAQRASLQQVLGQVRDAVEQLRQATGEILMATHQQSAGASQQSMAISEMVTAIEQVREIVQLVLGRAEAAQGASEHTVSVSHSGVQAVQDTIASMLQIRGQVGGIADNTLALLQLTQQVEEIITTVNDLAIQANILALNAAVEASRAGPQGQGFSVVATEVRNLANQSRDATWQVQEILSQIQLATRLTVQATEEGTRGVDAGVRQVAQAQEAIRLLTQAIDESAQVVIQMVNSGQQQSVGVTQIATAINSINDAMQLSLLNTVRTEQSARDLNLLAQHLNEIVVQYGQVN